MSGLFEARLKALEFSFPMGSMVTVYGRRGRVVAHLAYVDGSYVKVCLTFAGEEVEWWFAAAFASPVCEGGDGGHLSGTTK